VNIRFKLVSIENVQLKSSFDGFDFSSLDENSLKFQYKIDTVLKISEDIISVNPGIRYSYRDKELYVASAVFVFSIMNMDTAITVDKVNQQINVKADLFPSLLSAAYNTLRGIVFANTTDSDLRQYPLPMIDTKTLIDKNGISVEDEVVR